MTWTRRNVVLGASLIPVIPLLAQEHEPDVYDKLRVSRLIYLTPIKSDGFESKCQGEVWFVYDGTDIFVNTQADAWRAEAIRKGLTAARIWVGDFGFWTRSNGAYKDAPSLELTGKIESDADEWEEVFPVFGAKYSDEWPTWGPRFKNGLEDGSRVLLRYSIKQ